MNRLLSIILLGLVFATACKKGETVEYEVICDNCEVSYWNENEEFISRIPATGTWTYSFEAEAGDVIKVAAQSQFCANHDCSDTLVFPQLALDSVTVSIKVNGALVEQAKAGNTAFASAFVETNL